MEAAVRAFEYDCARITIQPAAREVPYYQPCNQTNHSIDVLPTIVDSFLSARCVGGQSDNIHIGEVCDGNSSPCYKDANDSNILLQKRRFILDRFCDSHFIHTPVGDAYLDQMADIAMVELSCTMLFSNHAVGGTHKRICVMTHPAILAHLFKIQMQDGTVLKTTYESECNVVSPWRELIAEREILRCPIVV